MDSPHYISEDFIYSIDFPIELRQQGLCRHYIHKKENISGNFHLSLIVQCNYNSYVILEIIICNDIHFLLFVSTYFTATQEDYKRDRSIGNYFSNCNYTCYRINV